MFGKEDDVRFRQSSKIFVLIKDIRVNQTAVKSRALRQCSGVSALYFDVKKSFAISGKGVKSDTAPVFIRHEYLRFRRCDNEFIVVENDAKNQLRTFNVVVETHLKKDVVHQAEFFDIEFT